MNIHLHIERLVLEGLPIDSHQAMFVRVAMESELARLVSSNGWASGLSGGVVPFVSGSAIQFVDGNDARSLGHQIAQALYRGLDK